MRPELLAPAGDWQAMRAAVAAGADAVYFGVQAFNARQRAENFRIEELPELMDWLHSRQVAVFSPSTCWCSAMSWSGPRIC